MLSQIILIVGLYAVFSLFEIPFFAEPNHGIKNRWRNIFLGAVLFVSGIFTVGLIDFFIPFKVRYLPYHGIAFSILILIIYVFLTDAIFYWYHRAEHTFRFMWAIHELHHSDTELNVTTSMRTYWLERPLQTLLISIPIQYLIGIDPTAVALLPIILTVWLCFTHANWRLRLGFLTPVICGPQLHRIHHSTLPEHENKNLAQYFPILDILFGTYYAPAWNEFPPTGTPGLASDASMSKLLVSPLETWAELAKPVSETKAATDKSF